MAWDLAVAFKRMAGNHSNMLLEGISRLAYGDADN